MPQPIKLSYGTETTVNIPLNGLAPGWAQSDVIDNTSDLFVDFLLELTIDFPNLAPGSGQDGVVYFAASFDGVNFMGDGNLVTGTAGSYSGTTSNLLWLMQANVTQNTITRYTTSMTYEEGFVPPFFSLLVFNDSGQTWGTNSALKIVGVKVQVG